jgi:hypothetical protein
VPLTRSAFGLIADDSRKKLASLTRILTRSLAEPLGHNIRAFRRASDWKLSLKQILFCPDLLENSRDQLAAVTRSSPDFAVTEALPDVAGDPLPCQAHPGLKQRRMTRKRMAETEAQESARLELRQDRS